MKEQQNDNLGVGTDRLEDNATAGVASANPDDESDPTIDTQPTSVDVGASAQVSPRSIAVVGVGAGGCEIGIAIAEKMDRLGLLVLADSSSEDSQAWRGRRDEMLSNGFLDEDRIALVQTSDSGEGAKRNPLLGMYDFYTRLYQHGTSKATMELDMQRALLHAHTLTIEPVAISGGTGTGTGPPMISLRYKNADNPGVQTAVVVVDPLDPNAEDFSQSVNAALGLAQFNMHADLVIPFDNDKRFTESSRTGRIGDCPSPRYRRELLAKHDAVQYRPGDAWTKENPEAAVINDYIARVVQQLGKFYADPGNSRTRLGTLQHETSSGEVVDIRWALPCLWPLADRGLDIDPTAFHGDKVRDLVVATLTRGQLCAGTVLHSARGALVMGTVPRRFNETALVRRTASAVLGLPVERIQVSLKEAGTGEPFEMAALLAGAQWEVLNTLSDPAALARLEDNLNDRWTMADQAKSRAFERAEDAAKKQAINNAWNRVEEEFDTHGIAGSGMNAIDVIAAMGEASRARRSSSFLFTGGS